jgi:hypothetical protein
VHRQSKLPREGYLIVQRTAAQPHSSLLVSNLLLAYMYRPILRTSTGYMSPMFSSFLLGAATQLQKSNLSAAERGLSANVTKFLLGRFYCHIADWPLPLPRGQNLSAQRSAHRVYAAPPQAAGRQAPSRTPVPSSPRPRRDCLHAERTDAAGACHRHQLCLAADGV